MTMIPAVDVFESDEALWVRADLPGVDENSVEVRLDENVLSISGKVFVDEYRDLTPCYTEYTPGNFHRRFGVPSEIDPDRIRARMVNGVLELELGKSERARPRRIEVAGG